jgi:hypothetical protein
VQSIFNVVTEVAHRHREWEREIAAAALHAQVRPQTGGLGWSPMTFRILTSLRTLARPWVTATCWNSAGVKCTRSLAGGRATAT